MPVLSFLRPSNICLNFLRLLKPEDWIFSDRVTSVQPKPGYHTALWFTSVLQASAVCKWSFTYTS